LIFHQLAQHYKALIITTITMTHQQSSMMGVGDHSNEETEYPTNSVVDDHDDILVPTLPPLPTEEEQDLWRGYLMIFFLIFFLGGAYCALKNYERRWLFECTWYGGVCCPRRPAQVRVEIRTKTPVFSCK
jgi:hypothetical protein